ncbi:DnaJ C-terminal domain-containing protein [Sphingobacterium sp. JB170]|uniref:DnaJ C-terminal domain-containing protein n=1 Tax=Sphingobacterium sp. JB170 TaxID=1434842 RepID=UPI00097E7C5E|nr:DnaJ C-terminal domain-containing protein [Sphingobacterium sp. JB170]SJN32158.1 DnaJ-class molecular chaperone CbpA [Sphingobacterium sp. JB170]
MAFVDYYTILGVDKKASLAEIKKAYRKLARKYHPDINPNDEIAKQKFQEINEANEVLTDTEKRKKYDQYGENWKNGDTFQQGSRNANNDGYSPFESQDYGYSGNYDEEQFSDFFEQMFGSRRGGGHQPKFRGNDINANLELTLQAAYSTHQETFNINGKNIRITIPAGIADRQRIRLAGQGTPGINGGPAGDLYIAVHILPDAKFTRKGNDLYADIPVDLYSMLLGGEILINTFGGKIKVKVKPETKNETVIRLKGKGFPLYKKEGQFGDLLVKLQAQLPVALTDEEKTLIQRLVELRK